MKVYVVTEGEYSDYKVCAVFSTIEKANEYSEMFSMNTPNEYELDERNGFIESHKGLKYFYVDMERNGNTVAVGKNEEDDLDFSRVKDHIIQDEYGPDYICVNCWAKDEKHAVKIANEKRIQLIANNQWEESPKKDPNEQT